MSAWWQDSSGSFHFRFSPLRESQLGLTDAFRDELIVCFEVRPCRNPRGCHFHKLVLLLFNLLHGWSAFYILHFCWISCCPIRVCCAFSVVNFVGFLVLSCNTSNIVSHGVQAFSPVCLQWPCHLLVAHSCNVLLKYVMVCLYNRRVHKMTFCGSVQFQVLQCMLSACFLSRKRWYLSSSSDGCPLLCPFLFFLFLAMTVSEAWIQNTVGTPVLKALADRWWLKIQQTNVISFSAHKEDVWGKAW